MEREIIGKQCFMCHKETIFFIWCNSGNIDKDRMRLYIADHNSHISVVCNSCAKEKGLLKERPPLDINKPLKHVTWDEMRRKDYSVIWR